MNSSEKIKTINNKIEQNKTPYNLDKQTANISALSSANISEYEFLTGKDLLPEIELLEKAIALKNWEFSLLGKELKKQTSVAEKQYLGFDNVFNHYQKEEPVKIKKERLLTTDKSSHFYNKKYSFIEFKNVEKYTDDSLLSRYNNYLTLF